MSMALINESGEQIWKWSKTYTFLSGHNTLNYEFDFNHIPVGNYHLKVTDDKGTIFIDKILTFK